MNLVVSNVGTPRAANRLWFFLAVALAGCGGDDPLTGTTSDTCVGAACNPSMVFPTDGAAGNDGYDAGEVEEVFVPPPSCLADMECDDGEPCTADTCPDGECVYSNLTDLCDDGNSCTSGDQCSEGTCVGIAMDCDNGHMCQVGVCKEGVCKYEANPVEECALKVDIYEPVRAASFEASSPILLSGMIKSPASPDVTLTLNGETLGFAGDGSFSHEILPHLGINIIELVAIDGFEREVRAARSFAFANEFRAPGSAFAPEKTPGCCGAWLADEAFDDNNTADLDDLATVVHLLLATFDINAVIPKPMYHKVSACNFEITVGNIEYSIGYTNFEPVNGALELSAQINNISGDFDIYGPSVCPNAEGVFTADMITIDATLTVKVTQFQNFEVELQSLNVKIVNPDPTFTGGVLSVFNWLTNWFEDDLSEFLVSKLETWVLENVSPLITGILNEMADYKMTFEVPGFGPGASGMTVGLDVDPEHVHLDTSGASFAVEVGLGANKGTTHSAPGSIVRGYCPHSNTLTSPVMPKSSAVEAYVHEDTINQAFFAVWWGGLTSFTVGPEVIGQYVTGYDLSDLSVDVDPWLPPVVTSCNTEGKLEAQIGDIHTVATFGFLDQSARLEFFVSARGSASFYVVDNPDGPNHIALQLDDVDQLALELVSIDGLDPIKEALLTLMLTDAVVELFINQFLADVAGAYPIPNVDLSQWVDPSVHEKPILHFEIDTLKVDSGFVVLGGTVLNP